VEAATPVVEARVVEAEALVGAVLDRAGGPGGGGRGGVWGCGAGLGVVEDGPMLDRASGWGSGGRSSS
jgi:hypothetical protein